MRPLIYHPDWGKEKLWEESKCYIHNAIQHWNIPTPMIIPQAPPNGRRFSTGGTLYGEWVRPSTIYVNVPLSSMPPSTRGRKWSYPGHKSDRTCCGILAHEFAHHIAGHRKMDALEWRKVILRSKPVTSYEPTPNEAWAETMRIFILNPQLLELARPSRYFFILRYFSPIHSYGWKHILANAPDFIIKSAEKFINEGGRPCNKLI